MKSHFVLNGEEDIPTHIHPNEWKRLLKYWVAEKQLKKAETMTHATKHVKNYSGVGKKGQVGKEAVL